MSLLFMKTSPQIEGIFFNVFTKIIIFNYYKNESMETSNQIDQSNNRIQLVVVDEHSLGYIIPEMPNTFNVLHASILKGSTLRDSHNYSIDWFKNIRKANEIDFHNYRIVFTENGFGNSNEYDFEPLTIEQRQQFDQQLEYESKIKEARKNLLISTEVFAAWAKEIKMKLVDEFDGLKVNDSVAFTNDYGVVFLNKIVGIAMKDNQPNEAKFYLESDAWWAPVKRSSLTLVD